MFFILSVDSKVSHDTRIYNDTIPDNRRNYVHDLYDGNIHNDKLLTEVFSYNGVTLKLDKGWHERENSNHRIWFKGYSNEKRLKDMARDGDFEATDGSYCFIVFDKMLEEYNIYHDKDRGFPIYYTNGVITNIYSVKTLVDYDHKVKLTRNHKIIVEYMGPMFVIPENIKNDLSITEIIEIVKPMMINKIKGFIKYNDVKNLEVQASGGLDTLTIIALLNTCNISYKKNYVYNLNISVANGISGTNWTMSGNPFMKHLSKYHWGFRQCNYYETETWVASGFWGDEMLMRNPLRVHWVLHYYGIDLVKEHKKCPESYMYGFIQQDYEAKIKKYHKEFSTQKELYETIMMWTARDYQISHVDNVIMFSPFKGLDLLFESFKMSNEAILDQVINGALQKQIIQDINPSLLKQLDTYKNHRTPM